MPQRKAPRTQTTPATAIATTPMTDAAIRALISRGVADALAEYEIQRNNNLNGDGSQGSGSGITRPVCPTRECTYTDFLKCQPMKFKGTEGVVGLTQWFERMVTVFNISKCAVENQVKFATFTLHDVALTWWKSYVKTVGRDATHSMPCNTLIKMMTTKRMFPEESDKIKKYVGGLPDMIYGSVMASKPKTMQDAVKFATEVMDKKIRTFAEWLTLLGLVRRNLTEDLNLYAQNATINMMDSVPPNATSATELAIWPVTIGVLQMPILLTTKEALWKNLAFLSSENTSSTNEVSLASGNFEVNTAGGTSSSSQVSSTPGADEVVCFFFAQQTTSSPLDNEDLQQIEHDT
ncbi:hypothetical protein Tco_0129599 [Tanacetum coccineum]